MVQINIDQIKNTTSTFFFNLSKYINDFSVSKVSAKAFEILDSYPTAFIFFAGTLFGGSFVFCISDNKCKILSISSFCFVTLSIVFLSM